MKTKAKKLSLNKETLKNLTTRQLDKVAGGGPTARCQETIMCTAACTGG
jgi:hypothetical protein